MEMKEHELINKGCRIRYWIVDGGQRAWICLLHGAGADHRTFLEQVEALTDRYNLLLMDGRGQGQSTMLAAHQPVVFSDMIDDLIQIMDAHKIDQAILIGQSLGAALAQEIAYVHPERVSKMVLIGCYNQHGTTDLRWKIRNYLMVFLLRIVPWRYVAARFGKMSSKFASVQAYMTETLRIAGRRSWASLGMTAYATKHEVTQYERPRATLLIRGEDDFPAMLAPIYAQLLAANPLAQEVVIPHAGHACNMENVAATNRAIIEFL